MSDETSENPDPQEERTIAAGRLRPYPAGAPQTTWNPEAGASAAEPEPEREREREVGSLEQRSESRRRQGVRRVYGMPSLQALGWSMLLLGGIIYLHGLWATANAVLLGRSQIEQVVSIGDLQILQGTIGLAIAALGLVIALIFLFLPVRDEPRLVPGTLEFEVAAENLLRGRMVRRILILVGVALFIVGVAIAAFALRESIVRGELYRLSLGGVGYRVHLLGFLLAAIGLVVALPLALSQGTVEQAAALAEGALQNGRVRRRGREEEDEAPPRRIRPVAAPEERKETDWLAPREGEDEVAPERRLRPMGAPAERPESSENEPEESTRRFPPT